MFITIKLQNGSKLESSFKKNSVTIGRSSRADLVVHDDALSRFHAQIDYENGQYYVTDLASANGVFIDDQKILANEKIHFATYRALNIGPLECTIQDDLELDQPISSTNELPRTQKNKPEQPKEKIEIPRHSSKNKKEVKSGSLDPKVVLVVILILFGGYHFLMEDDVVHQPSDENQINQGSNPPPSQIRKTYRARVPNENTILDIYLNHFSQKSCIGMNDLCKQLQIEENSYEGFVKNQYELFIFIKPSKLFNQARLSALKDQNKSEDLLAHYLVMGSEVLQLLLKHEVDQIHVIIISENNQPTRAYRYHISRFESGEIDPPSLLDAMASGIQSQQIKEVAENILKIFPPLSFNQTQN